MTEGQNDDPRKLRAMLTRVTKLAETHAVASVVVGLSADEGDAYFPDFVCFLQSALRVEDGIFRMTRERAVLHIADADRPQAQEILRRLQEDFWSQYPTMEPSAFGIRFFDVKPGCDKVHLKEVLNAIFSTSPSAMIH